MTTAQICERDDRQAAAVALRLDGSVTSLALYTAQNNKPAKSLTNWNGNSFILPRALIAPARLHRSGAQIRYSDIFLPSAETQTTNFPSWPRPDLFTRDNSQFAEPGTGINGCYFPLRRHFLGIFPGRFTLKASARFLYALDELLATGFRFCAAIAHATHTPDMKLVAPVRACNYEAREPRTN